MLRVLWRVMRPFIIPREQSMLQLPHNSTPIKLGVEPLQCPSRPLCGEGGPLDRLTPTPHTLPMTRAMPTTLARRADRTHFSSCS